jgi:PAS domain S-box-containing protein
MSNIPLPGLLRADGTPGVDTRLLEQIFDQMHDTAFFIKDEHGRYRVVNHSLVERHGFQSKSQVLGRRPCDLCPGDFGRLPAEQDAQVLRTGKPIIERLELHWHTPHRPVWCLTTKLPIRDAQGRVNGIIGISKDLGAPVPTQEIPVGVTIALRRLETGYDEPITPSQLAALAHMPPTRFARIIKRIHGISPMQLITKTRIAAGSRLLRESQQTIADIALQCGFCDHSAFTRAFRSLTGLSPTQFRAGAEP